MNPKEGIKQLFKTNKIQNADFKESFEQLSDEEKNYIYYLSKACWAGQPIVLFQSSYESPALFIIFQTFFSSFKEFSEIKPYLLKNSITDVNYTKFIRYAANFYSNFGNYTTQFRKKFFPALKLEDFDNILQLSTKYNDIKSIWEIVKYIIYDNTENVIGISYICPAESYFKCSSGSLIIYVYSYESAVSVTVIIELFPVVLNEFPSLSYRARLLI